MAQFMHGHCDIPNIKAVGLMVSVKIFVLCFSIESLTQLHVHVSVAMEATILIQSAPKPYAVNPHGGSH